MNSVRTEFEIKELSVTKLTDTRVQKLMDLFITPRLVEISPVRDPRIKKKLKRTRVNLEDIIESKGHFVIEGDPGSGKSRLVNKFICDLLEPSRMTDDVLYLVEN